MTSNRRCGRAVSAVALLVGLGGCISTGGMGGMGTPTPMMSQGATASGRPTMSGMYPSAGGHVNGADVMFVQMMLPHHAQAVTMSTTLLTKSGISAKSLNLARQIRAAQGPEITTMEGWLEDWGQKPMNSGSEGMSPGDGMATGAELKAFDEADGVAVERLYLTLMTAHHAGAITMASTEIQNGQNPDAVELAKNIVVSQQKEIITMKTLLGER